MIITRPEPPAHEKERNPDTGRMRCWAGCPGCVANRIVRRRLRRQRERARGGPCRCRAYWFPHRIGGGKCYYQQPRWNNA